MGNRREFEESASKVHSAWQPFGSILFIGRLFPEKGVSLIPAIASQLLDTRVHIVGAGPLSGWLADHNPGNIILHGFISEDQKIPLVVGVFPTFLA
jgi:glycosyltransferase involved in cell wall biosynthesis